MKLGKINPMQIGTTMLGAGGGAYAGELAADKITEMVENDMAETGVLLIGSAVGAYLENTQKGVFASAGAGFAGELVKTVLKKFIGGAETAAATTKAVKGVEAEIGEIYDEMSKALEVRGNNDPVILGTNEPIILGYNDNEE